MKSEINSIASIVGRLVLLLVAIATITISEYVSASAAGSETIRSTSAAITTNDDNLISNDDLSTCSITQTSFRLELQTDQNPKELSWELMDVNSAADGMIFSMDEGTYDLPGSFYNMTFCVETSSCHQFTIHDLHNNGICCDNGIGWYEAFYDNELIMKGSDFGESDMSTQFGNTCPFISSSTSSLGISTTSKLARSLSYPSSSESLTTTQYCAYEYLVRDNYVISISGLKHYVTKLNNDGVSWYGVESSTGWSTVGALVKNMPTNKAHYAGGDYCDAIGNKSSGSFEVVTSSSSNSSTLTASKVSTCMFQMTLTVPETNAFVFDTTGIGSNVCGSLDTQDSGMTYTMVGGGDDIWSTEDSFYFAKVAMSASDFTAVVFVKDGFTNPNSHEEAAFGLMVRDTIDPKSRHFSAILTARSGLWIYYRPDYGSETESNDQRTSHQGGCWLKIIRSGGTFYRAYYKPKDEENYIFLAAIHIELEGSVEVGLGLSSVISASHKSDKIVFSSFSITTSPPTESPISSPPTSSLSSLSPTSSNVPTSSPIAVDKYGRRYFPDMRRPEGSFSYQPVPNCTSHIGRLGCVGIPASFPEGPYWSGKIHQTPPSCYNGQCELGIPMSRNENKIYEKALRPTPDSLNFEDQILIDSNLGTQSVLAADLNGDSMVDIIVCNFNQPVQLLLNDGNGKFLSAVDLPGDTYHEDSTIALGDVNGDGMLDLIVSHSSQGNKILLNYGNGSFETPKDLPGGTKTMSIAVADIDGDGMVDIIIGSYNEDNAILFNEGDGSFKKSVNLPGGHYGTSSVAIADINGDGMLDIIIGAGFGSWGGQEKRSNQILLNKGNRTFGNAVLLPGGKRITKSVAAADINGDGMVDIIIGNHARSNQLLLNRGDGSFVDVVDLPGGTLNTESVVAADVNGDGMLDIIIGNDGNGQSNQVLLNEGDGSFLSAKDLPGDILKTKSIAAADINGDGMVDIVVGNYHTDKTHPNQLLLNKGNIGSWSAKDFPGGTLDTRSSSTADMNGDGMLDIITGNYGNNNQLLLNEGGGSFGIPVDLPGGTLTTHSVAIADVNGDGMMDIIIGNDRYANQLLLNQGDGSFGNVVDLPGGKLTTYSVAIADVNGDGTPDIIIGNGSSEYNQLLLNEGNGKFGSAEILPGGTRNTKSIIAADINGDGMVDIVIGNYGLGLEGEHNQLLLNEGDGSFVMVADFPGGKLNTLCVVAADINGDGMLDIIIGNGFQNNTQILLNKANGSFLSAENLPGNIDAISIAAADINGDGMVDIVIGAKTMNQLLLNNGNGSFESVEYLPGATNIVNSVIVADINGDGLLDIITGNNGSNQIILFDACPSGGSRLHSKSWCFQCPSFMGREGDVSICRECMPDYMQQPGNDECAHSDLPCPFGERKLGQDSCSNCLGGNYYDNSLSRVLNDISTWDPPRCVPCPVGQYVPNDIIAIDECFKCRPGSYQRNPGEKNCTICAAGTFQSDFGKDDCIPCAVGGYCDEKDSSNGGFTSCPAGTYNDKLNQKDVRACQQCQTGTYSISVGANSSSDCGLCSAGTYTDLTGQIQCKPCSPGTFQKQPGQMSCDNCPSGTYANKTGFEECIKCPYRLSSIKGGRTCPFCDNLFYLNNDENTDQESIFQNPSQYCLPCPSKGSCQVNSTLEKIGILPGYWRRSTKTSKLYRCKQSNICVGIPDGKNTRDDRYSLQTRLLLEDGLDDSITGVYCKDGHTGPLCEVCVDNDNYYFSPERQQCEECPSSFFRLILQCIGILFGIIAAVSALIFIATKYAPSLLNLASNLSLRAKFKLLVTFYQIFSSFQDVYGIKLDFSMKWIKILFQYLSLDFIQIFRIPMGCLGSFQQQLVLIATWPYIAILIGIILVGIGILDKLKHML